MIPSSEPTCPHIPCLSLSLKKTQSSPMAIIASIIMRSQLSQVGRESKNSMGYHLLSQCTLSAYCGSAVHTLMCRIFVRKSIYAPFDYFTMILFVFQESGGSLLLKEAPLARKARGGGLNHLSQYMLRKQGTQQPYHPCVVFLSELPTQIVKRAQRMLRWAFWYRMAISQPERPSGPFQEGQRFWYCLSQPFACCGHCAQTRSAGPFPCPFPIRLGSSYTFRTPPFQTPVTY